MNPCWSVMAVVFLLAFQGAPSRDPLSINIDSPASGTLKGVVEFEVSFENPGGKNLTVSLYCTVAGEDRFELIAQDITNRKQGDLSMSFDTGSLDNGEYGIKAVGDTDDQTVETAVVGFTIFNPKEPLIKWVSPKSNAVLKGAYAFKVNITGDHGGLDGAPEFYYKLESGSVWTFMGKAGTVTGTTVWELSYDTMLIPDSSYYFLANVTSVHGLYSESVVGPLQVDNEHPPEVTLVEPSEGSTLSGEVTLKATALDVDGNINPDGVVFYSSRPDSEAMSRIGSDPDPQDGVYSISWDSLKLANGRYKIWAYVRDTGSPSTSAWSGFNVTIKNPLVIQNIRSIGQESKEWALEVVIKEGPKAYPLLIGIDIDQGSGWKKGTTVSVSTEPVVAGPIKVRATVPISLLKEGNVSVRATVRDSFGADGILVAKDLFSYEPMIRPMVRVISPVGPLKGNATVIAEVLDDDAPLTGPVKFFYSTDNKTWVPIGVGTFYQGRTYKVIWDTSLVANFTDYHIRANHTDSDGLTGEGYMGGFEVRNEHSQPPPPPPPQLKWYETRDGILTAMGVIALVSALLAVFVAISVGFARKNALRKERLRKIEAERERQKGIGQRARMREKELEHMLYVGSKFQEPVRKPTPRGSVPLKPAEMGIKKFEAQVEEPPKPKPTLQEFEHPAPGRERM